MVVMGLWSGRHQEPRIANGSCLSSSPDSRIWESDNLKFPLVNRANTTCWSRKWHSREETNIDTEYDVVIVPPDGGCVSGSESDGSDYSIGWMEPHGPGIISNDDSDNSFAVLVPCYYGRRQDDMLDDSKNNLVGAIVNIHNYHSVGEMPAKVANEGQFEGKINHIKTMVLQKAAYSWWWVSHIRTKQSKWLQLNLQDMEGKICSMLEIIDGDGDSFARRAEIYFKKRPELVSMVEECYRAYQALAERYDHLSNDLQSANRTIATVFPEQVPYSVHDEQDNEESPSKTDEVPIPGLDKDEALHEVDKLHKEISDMQTGREFLYKRLCEIDDQITEKQRRASDLEVEFGVRSGNQKFEAARNKFDSPTKNQQKKHVPTKSVDNKVKHDSEVSRNETDEGIDESLNASRTLSQLEEKIDELVQRVATWETAFLSEKRLKSEEDELRGHGKIPEEDMKAEIQGPEIMNTRMNMLEGEIVRFTDLVRSVVDEINSLKTHSIESSFHVDDLSVKPEADAEPVREMEQAPGDHRSSIKDKDVSASSMPDTEMEELESDDDGEEEEEQPNWRQMFLDGVDDREKVVMEEYSSVVANYKDVRKKLNEVNKKSREGFFELAMQIRELKNAVSSRDGEIQSLHREIGFVDENKSSIDQRESLSLSMSQESTLTNSIQASPSGVDVVIDDEFIRKAGNNSNAACVWAVENKIRSGIDDLLEENLEFWLRFNAAFNQIKRYETSVKELKSRLREKSSKLGGKYKTEYMRSEIRPIYCELRELRTGLTLWMENNEALKAEVEGRYFSACNIENEIASSINSLSGFHHEAAKFRGEVAKMKQEINKVRSQSKTGSDRVRQVKVEVDNLINKLEKELGSSLISSMSQHQPSKYRRLGSRVPLRSFLFGIKLRNSKHSKGSSSMQEPKLTHTSSI